MGMPRLPGGAMPSKSVRKRRKFSWLPVKRIYQKGDTIFEEYKKRKYFMPQADYSRVGARSALGSVEGQYVSKKASFDQYQSVMHSCRMILTEKVNPIIQAEQVIYMKWLEPRPGSPRQWVWDADATMALEWTFHAGRFHVRNWGYTTDAGPR